MRKPRIQNELYIDAAALACGVSDKLNAADAKLFTLDQKTRLVVSVLMDPFRCPARKLRPYLSKIIATAVVIVGTAGFFVGLSHSPDQGALWQGFGFLSIAVMAAVYLAIDILEDKEIVKYND